jgi:hypothetical protein
MFETLEEDVERLEGHPSKRERWIKFLMMIALTIVVFGGLYLALTLLEA